MRTLIYGVEPVDPLVIVAACASLVIVAALASYLPARRAARLDPVTVLRSA
jgi:ABC-type lipoprotein release transport system permease subunit